MFSKRAVSCGEGRCGLKRIAYLAEGKGRGEQLEMVVNDDYLVCGTVDGKAELHSPDARNCDGGVALPVRRA